MSLCVSLSLSLSPSLSRFIQIVFFYFTCRKNVIRDRSTEDDVHLVHRELDVGKQTNKSVQVEHIIGYS